ncbi:hypothetical protein [Lacrimispora sp. 210928-DFI.3.58]|uniref:hypothetical protein n=1 Tax=Lacrimispora sp. 210928-DFI.3.58 TaxID=2883214 RepID=UPI001D062946|nr:hypothetical protein [Lacrimispora sp. 210928-DFI.3.58]MCB7317551.1 hypothetical protein [Lacrimispora sp. 210928-DFI.3.58]
MHKNRIRTATAAKIMGVSSTYLLEKMRLGEWDIGEYRKNGNRASPIIWVNKLAQYLGRSISEIDQAVEEIEGGARR